MLLAKHLLKHIFLHHSDLIACNIANDCRWIKDFLCSPSGKEKHAEYLTSPHCYFSNPKSKTNSCTYLPSAKNPYGNPWYGPCLGGCQILKLLSCLDPEVPEKRILHKNGYFWLVNLGSGSQLLFNVFLWLYCFIGREAISQIARICSLWGLESCHFHSALIKYW